MTASRPRQPRWQRLQRYGLCCLLGLWVLLAGLMAPPVTAQENTEPGSPIQILRTLENLTSTGLSDFLEETPSNIAVAPVHLDGRVVFEVAAPAQPSDRDFGLTASERAQEVEERLKELARSGIDPETLDVTWKLDGESNQPVIAVNGQLLLTITSLDAELKGTGSLAFTAGVLSREIKQALLRYHRERQPEFLRRRTQTLAIAWVVVAGISTLLAVAQRLVARSRDRVRQATTEPTMTERLVEGPANDFRRTLLTRQHVKMLRVEGQVLKLLQAVLWLGTLIWSFGLYPQTRWLQKATLLTLRLPVRFFIIVLLAYGLIRLSDIWLDRFFLALQEQAHLNREQSQRLALRLSTFSEVLKGIVSATIGMVALLVILAILGIQIAPLIAGAGIVGIGISLASQSLIKDIINGTLILLEDHYGVGDFVTVCSVSGFVETMNLRVTQIRDIEGRLITVPNSHIDVVQNWSKDWSQVDFMVPVGLDANLDQALRLVEKVAYDMSRDGIWGPMILEPPTLLGVDHLDHVGATIRLWIKTRPLKQWDVGREYRRRLKIAFEQAKIPIGVPQQRVQLPDDPRLAAFMGHSSSAPSEPS